MPPIDVDLRLLIEQLDRDLPGDDPLAKVGEARQRARTLADIGEQLVDHFVSQARAQGSSWSQIGDALGVSKQAVQQRWVPPVFRAFTDRSRHVIVLAQERARSLRHDAIGTEHLLLGLLAERDGLGGQILRDLGADTDAVERALGPALEPGTAHPSGRVPFTRPAANALDGAGHAALELGHDFVGTEHLLLGLLRATGGDAARALAGLGVTAEPVRAEVAARVEAMMRPSRSRHSD